MDTPAVGTAAEPGDNDVLTVSMVGDYFEEEEVENEDVGYIPRSKLSLIRSGQGLQLESCWNFVSLAF